MPLRGRVGRHANTGAHCRNWKGDQLVVIALLNRIPATNGGAGESLAGRVVGGLASNELYQAILRFQKQHFPHNQTGFIEPRGPMLARMEMLASSPPLAAKPVGQWDTLATQSVRRGVNKGLDDDMRLSHTDVVNIVRSTLSDGIITANELNDLTTVSTQSKSILPRSRSMLDMLVAKIRKSSLNTGPYRLRTDNHSFAAQLACSFLERSAEGRFGALDRDEVGIGMLMRIANPGILNQDQASLCGPAALLFSVLTDDPVAYTQFAIGLYERGRASLYRLDIKPREGVRNYRPPSTMDHIDWLTMASIRDSENWGFSYDTADKEFAGITLPGELALWFRRAGYSDVREETNLKFIKDIATIDEANRLFGQGYSVCLFVSSNMLTEKDQSDKGSIFTMHWAVQRSPIDRSDGKIRLRVFTWGEGEYPIPHGGQALSVANFLDNFHGYVAGKP